MLAKLKEVEKAFTDYINASGKEVEEVLEDIKQYILAKHEEYDNEGDIQSALKDAVQGKL